MHVEDLLEVVVAAKMIIACQHRLQRRLRPHPEGPPPPARPARLRLGQLLLQLGRQALHRRQRSVPSDLPPIPHFMKDGA